MTSGFKCSLSDLKNKRVAQCAEKASVAQNILLAIIQTGLIKKFNSNFVSSKLNNNPHAFILLENKEKEGTSYIFDIENPSTIILPDGTKKTFVGVYPISREQLIDFYNGKSIKLKSILHGKNGMKETGVDRFYGNEAVKLYNQFNDKLRNHIKVETGIFGADMKVSLTNDGPVTILLEK